MPNARAEVTAMNKENSRHNIAAILNQNGQAKQSSIASRCVRLGLTTALVSSLALCRHDASWGQQQRNREPEVRVTGIAASGSTVSITADGSLNRAQTWQDGEGFHVVLVNGQSELTGSPRGVKMRRIGNSLELVVPVRSGANVTVQPNGNRLDLVMSGGAADARVESAPETIAAERPAPRARREESAPAARAQRAAPAREEARNARSESIRPQQRDQAPEGVKRAEQPAMAGGATKSVAQPVEQPVAQGGDAPPAPEMNSIEEATDALAVPPAAAQLEASSEASVGAKLLSLPAMLVLLLVALTGALLALTRRRKREEEEDSPIDVKVRSYEPRKMKAGVQGGGAAKPEQAKADRRRFSIAVPFERRRKGAEAEDAATRRLVKADAPASAKDVSSDTAVVSPALPAIAFGAYRIDQEVSRLVEGKAHSTEVLSSRAPDDRRAIETSLIKALRAPETDEEGRRRVRMAMEDYGFVARSCASLLLGAESFDRASAAHTLGEMRSAQALPFLTEALYDQDAVVRAEAVQSLGSLGLPSAIGALLDTARRHPDIPTSLLGPALTACSVESLDPAWNFTLEGYLASDDGGDDGEEDVRSLAPLTEFDALPELMEDEALCDALERLASSDAETRLHCAQQLAHFQSSRAVDALAHLAIHDAEPSVRAAAVTSLASINHESIFVPVLISMGDESREVRAASARAFSRVSFDRADAYARLLETAGTATLGNVAHACVKAGLVEQSINRLNSHDRRQAFEAFTLLSLVVRGGEWEPLLETVRRHRDEDVRLACVRLLAQSKRTELAAKLRDASEGGGVTEALRDALLGAAARIEAAKGQAVLAE